LLVSAPVTHDTPPPAQHVTAEVRLRSKVSRWTTKEVIDWLTSNDLDPVTGRSVAPPFLILLNC